MTKHDAVLHSRLVAFFTDVKPADVANIPALLAKYDGKEEKMLSALERKYGKPVPGAAPAPATQTIIFASNKPLGFGIGNFGEKHGISSVRDGAQAQQLGLVVGDVIVSIGGDDLNGLHGIAEIANHLRDALKRANAAAGILEMIVERRLHDAAAIEQRDELAAVSAAVPAAVPAAAAVPADAAVTEEGVRSSTRETATSSALAGPTAAKPLKEEKAAIVLPNAKSGGAVAAAKAGADADVAATTAQATASSNAVLTAAALGAKADAAAKMEAVRVQAAADVVAATTARAAARESERRELAAAAEAKGARARALKDGAAQETARANAVLASAALEAQAEADAAVAAAANAEAATAVTAAALAAQEKAAADEVAATTARAKARLAAAAAEAEAAQQRAAAEAAATAKAVAAAAAAEVEAEAEAARVLALKDEVAATTARAVARETKRREELAAAAEVASKVTAAANAVRAAAPETAIVSPWPTASPSSAAVALTSPWPIATSAPAAAPTTATSPWPTVSDAPAMSAARVRRNSMSPTNRKRRPSLLGLGAPRTRRASSAAAFATSSSRDGRQTSEDRARRRKLTLSLQRVAEGTTKQGDAIAALVSQNDRSTATERAVERVAEGTLQQGKVIQALTEGSSKQKDAIAALHSQMSALAKQIEALSAQNESAAVATAREEEERARAERERAAAKALTRAPWSETVDAMEGLLRGIDATELSARQVLEDAAHARQKLAREAEGMSHVYAEVANLKANFDATVATMQQQMAESRKAEAGAAAPELGSGPAPLDGTERVSAKHRLGTLLTATCDYTPIERHRLLGAIDVCEGEVLRLARVLSRDAAMEEEWTFVETAAVTRRIGFVPRAHVAVPIGSAAAAVAATTATTAAASAEEAATEVRELAHAPTVATQLYVARLERRLADLEASVGARCDDGEEAPLGALMRATQPFRPTREQERQRIVALGEGQTVQVLHTKAGTARGWLLVGDPLTGLPLGYAPRSFLEAFAPSPTSSRAPSPTLTSRKSPTVHVNRRGSIEVGMPPRGFSTPSPPPRSSTRQEPLLSPQLTEFVQQELRARLASAVSATLVDVSRDVIASVLNESGQPFKKGNRGEFWHTTMSSSASHSY